MGIKVNIEVDYEAMEEIIREALRVDIEACTSCIEYFKRLKEEQGYLAPYQKVDLKDNKRLRKHLQYVLDYYTPYD